MIAGAASFVATGLIVGRWAHARETLRAAIEGELLAQDDAATAAARGIRRGGRELSRAVARLARAWRERLNNAEARSTAAAAVIAALPDPLILLDDRRRVVRANAQANSLVGAVGGVPDLAAVLRNPARRYQA